MIHSPSIFVRYNTYDLVVDEHIPDTLHGDVDGQTITPGKGRLDGFIGSWKAYLPISLGFQQSRQTGVGRGVSLRHDAADRAT